MAAYGADFLQRRFGLLGALAAMALLSAAVVDAWGVGVPCLVGVIEAADTPAADKGSFRQFANGLPGHDMYQLAKTNRGDPTCYQAVLPDPFGVVKGENQPGYRGEQYLTGPGSVALLLWTPNALSYEVDAPADTVLVINQNYYPAWKLVGGSGEVFSDDGLLGVRLHSGRQKIRLQFIDYYFIVGIIVTLAAIFGAVVLFRREAAARAR